MKKNLTKAYFLFFLLAISSCNTEKIKEPLTYTFDDVFVNYKSPAVVPTIPAATTSTLAIVSLSKANSEAILSFENNLGTTPSMTNTLEILQNKFNANVFSEIESSFNNAQITAMEGGQPLNTQLQKNITQIINSGAIESFRSILTKPTIDGVDPTNLIIGKSTYAHIFGVIETKIGPGAKDKCRRDADDEYRHHRRDVDSDKVNAEGETVNNYEVAVERAKKQNESDKKATKDRFKIAREKAKATFNNNKEKINNDKKLSKDQKTAAIAIQVVLYNDEIAKINLAEKEQEAADLLKQDAEIAKTTLAKDNDLMKIDAKYQEELNRLSDMYDRAKKKCHNQGGGGNNGNGNGNGD